MSSSPRAERAGAAWRRWGPAGWTLRVRLLAMLIALLAAVCVVIGVGTQVALRQYLTAQIDNQLEGAQARILIQERTRRGPPRPGPEGLEGLAARGLGPGTLAARVVDGKVISAGFLSSRPGNPPELLSPASFPALASVPVDRKAHTRELDDGARYRLIATQTSEGVLITGLPLEGVYDTLRQFAVVEAVVALAALVAAGLGGGAVIRLTLRPLRRVAATAGRVAELPLHEGEVAVAERVAEVDTDPRTEVGQVGAALNRLLGHVDAALAARQASEMRLRRFVADASHELRTPLASIRGYAELGRRTDEPDEVAQVLRRVEAQATRMTVLVEDLLLLARLDAGRPLERAPVDLSTVVVESVGDAHAAGPAYHWRLELPDDPVVVCGDAARLHQVLGNLLANARTHTPAGTTVTTALSTSDGVATLTVTDDGPGIPEDLRPHIFQRFARGDGSRSRTAGSTGLGLSIVEAVVSAHGGRVDVTSHPGRTVFEVTLPR
jgi:two-component system, OmpR family, sensor kinase